MGRLPAGPWSSRPRPATRGHPRCIASGVVLSALGAAALGAAAVALLLGRALRPLKRLASSAAEIERTGDSGSAPARDRRRRRGRLARDDAERDARQPRAGARGRAALRRRRLARAANAVDGAAGKRLLPGPARRRRPSWSRNSGRTPTGSCGWRTISSRSAARRRRRRPRTRWRPRPARQPSSPRVTRRSCSTARAVTCSRRSGRARAGDLRTSCRTPPARSGRRRASP